MAFGVAKALVVGGGIGGMALAIRLRAVGVSVDLIDIDPHWRAVGAGLTLNGATLRAFHMLGVLDEVAAAGHIHGGRRVHRIDGSILRDVPAYEPALDDIEAGGGILRPALHAILADRVKASGVRVALGTTVETLDQSDRDVTVTFSNGRVGVYDLVAGADGIMSRVRSLVFPDAGRPAFTGQGCWRAVFRRPDEVETSWLFVDPTHKVGFNPISADDMYMFMLEAAPGNPWHQEEDWPTLLRERMRAFGGLAGALADSVNGGSRTNYRPLETLLMPPPWHRGRVVLLGDAAHATTPHAGYGAGLAIEDALVLAESLTGSGDLEDRLQRYADRRYPRCRDVLQASIALGELEMAGAPVPQQLEMSGTLFALTRGPF